MYCARCDIYVVNDRKVVNQASIHEPYSIHIHPPPILNMLPWHLSYIHQSIYIFIHTYIHHLLCITLPSILHSSIVCPSILHLSSDNHLIILVIHKPIAHLYPAVHPLAFVDPPYLSSVYLPFIMHLFSVRQSSSHSILLHLLVVNQFSNHSSSVQSCVIIPPEVLQPSCSPTSIPSLPIHW